MPESPLHKRGDRHHHHAALVRGVAVNAAGLLIKLGGPLLIVVVTRLFGPAITGVFLLMQLLAELARSAISAGYNDAVTIFGSREAGVAASSGGDDQRMYEVVASVLRATAGFSVLLAIPAFACAVPLSHLFPELGGLAIAIRYAALSLPLIVVGQTLTAATKIRVRMEYDVGAWGFGRPMLLLASSILVWATGGGLRELMLAYFLVHIVLFAFCIWAFAHLFEARRARKALFVRARVAGLHRFAWPQNLNMTFSRYQSRVDVIALGMLGYRSEIIAFYVTGSLIATSLQEIRLIFSNALAPVVARYLHDRGALEHLMARVSRWTTSLIVPITALVIIWRGQMLLLVDKSYSYDSSFVALLLLATLAYSSVGLAGNYLVFMGHSGWNFVNSLFGATLNTVLSFVLIPHHGLMGAAFASCITAVVICSAQVVEVRYIERIRMLLREIYKPYVGLAVLVALGAAFWDPMHLGGPGALLGASLVAIGAYLLTLLLLGHEELTRGVRAPRAVVGVSLALAGLYLASLLLHN